MKGTVTVILPTLNEQENIIPLIRKINNIVHPKKIIVVDGGSCDKTCDLVDHNPFQYKNILLIRNKSGLGLTDSLNMGINKTKTPVIVWMDADLSHLPETIKLMYQKIKDYDAVIGSWLIKDGQDLRKNRLEVLRSKIINKICQLLFGNRITTYTSGFIMIRKSVFRAYKLEGDYGEYFIHLCVYLIRNNFKITEVPFNCKSRIYGKSKTSPNVLTLLKRTLQHITMIQKLVRLNRKTHSP